MSEERFIAIEGRLTKVEKTMVTKIEHQTLSDKIDEILTFVQGAKKVGGIAVKNWRAIMIFGAGIMTALGADNVKLWEFLVKFAGS